MALFRTRRTTESSDSASDERKDGGIVRFILTLAILAWIVRSLIFAPFHIPTGSMIPTLYIGDYVMVAKWPYGYSRFSFPFQFPSFSGRIFGGLPKRGDVVVFRHPIDDNDLIKRVIGLPGDTVEVSDGQLILNGKPVPKEDLPPFAMRISANSQCKVAPGATPMVGPNGTCLFPAYKETLPGGPSYTVLDQVDSPEADHFPATSVPAGFVFVMGDNRDDSMDSRFQPSQHGVGFLPVENIIGRATVTFWSTDGSASYWKPWTWFSALRGGRIGNGYTGLPE